MLRRAKEGESCLGRCRNRTPGTGQIRTGRTEAAGPRSAGPSKAGSLRGPGRASARKAAKGATADGAAVGLRLASEKENGRDPAASSSCHREKHPAAHRAAAPHNFSQKEKEKKRKKCLLRVARPLAPQRDRTPPTGLSRPAADPRRDSRSTRPDSPTRRRRTSGRRTRSSRGS